MFDTTHLFPSSPIPTIGNVVRYAGRKQHRLLKERDTAADGETMT